MQDAQPQIRLGLLIVMCFALLPIGFNEFSINYLFVAIPLFRVFTKGSFQLLPIFFIFALFCYVALFFLSIFLLPDGFYDPVRRIASWLIFISVFAFSFCKISDADIRTFKLALIIVSIIYSATIAIIFVRANLISAVGYEAKNIVGSQRFGFVYTLALWVLLFDQHLKSQLGKAKTIFIIILLIGIALTFSRAAIVALLASFFLFGLLNVRSNWRLIIFDGRVKVSPFIKIFMSFLAITTVYIVAPVTFQFYWDMFFAPLLDGRLAAATSHPTSSEGIRFERLQAILDYITDHPFLGSGFLGVWSILPSTGSAHNQYLDVLLRTGLIGFTIYLTMLFKMVRFLARRDKGLFYGLISILVYGFFHETFKDSQGAFIMSFILGIMSQDWRSGQHSIKRRSLQKLQ